MKKNSIRTILAIAVTAILTLALAACGGGGNGGNGSNAIGNKPQIPSFVPSTAPANATALATSWQSNNEFSDIETGGSGSGASGEFVTAKRTVGSGSVSAVSFKAVAADSGKEYEVVAFNYGTELVAQTFSAQRAAWETAKQFGETALKQALQEAGITNFNWDDTGISWTEDGYDHFVKVVGGWWFAQAPYEGGNGGDGGDDPGTNPSAFNYTLPENLKVTHSYSAYSSITVIKVGNDYYAYNTVTGGIKAYENYLKHDSVAGTWTKYSKTLGSSQWTAGTTITSSNLRAALDDDDFYGFMIENLSFARYYTFARTDFFLERAVKVYADGSAELWIDNETGLVLKESGTTMYTYQVTLWQTTDVNLSGIDLPL